MTKVWLALWYAKETNSVFTKIASAQTQYEKATNYNKKTRYLNDLKRYKEDYFILNEKLLNLERARGNSEEDLSSLKETLLEGEKKIKEVLESVEIDYEIQTLLNS